MENRKAHLTDMIDLAEGELAQHDARCMVEVATRAEVERANRYREIASDYVIMLADELQDDGQSTFTAREAAREYAHGVYMRVFVDECESLHCIHSIDCKEVEY